MPGGSNSPLGQLLDVAYTIEYGAECERQSALNLLYLLGYNSPGQFTLFGASNEKYHVRGGNDQIVARSLQTLGSQIVTGHALVAVRRNAAGTYTLTFQSGRRTTDVIADKVVFALPFSILNTAVDLQRAGFSDLKMIAIRELAMGSNSKLNVQFNSRPWVALGSNGETYSDRGYQLTWEVTRAQPGTAGILVDYTGGNIADTFGTARRRPALRSSSRKSSRCCPASARSGMAARRLTGGRAIRSRAAATVTGRSANTPGLPASKASRKATRISAANTPQSTPRAISKARWKPASAPPARSSLTCAELGLTKTTRFLRERHASDQ